MAEARFPLTIWYRRTHVKGLVMLASKQTIKLPQIFSFQTQDGAVSCSISTNLLIIEGRCCSNSIVERVGISFLLHFVTGGGRTRDESFLYFMILAREKVASAPLIWFLFSYGDYLVPSWPTGQVIDLPSYGNRRLTGVECHSQITVVWDVRLTSLCAVPTFMLPSTIRPNRPCLLFANG